MVSQIHHKPIKPFSTIASIIAALNILGTLLVGLMIFIVIEVSDPLYSDTFNLEAFYRQKDTEQLIVGVLMSAFIMIFIVSLIFWLKGNRFWDFILSGLALVHLVGINYLVGSYLVFLPIVFLCSLALDLVLVVVIFADKSIPYSPQIPELSSTGEQIRRSRAEEIYQKQIDDGKEY
jgi:hypothetical protein